MQCEVWSVEGRTRSGQVVFEHSSFMKLPPPACPGLCYTVALDSETQPRRPTGAPVAASSHLTLVEIGLSSYTESLWCRCHGPFDERRLSVC